MSKIDEILNNNGANYDVGEGGFGKVVVNSLNPTMVIKKSKSSGICDTWKDEFAFQDEIVKAWKKDFPDLNSYVEVVQVHEFMFNDNCFILMDRICPLLNNDIQTLNGQTAHAFIGDCTLEVKKSGNRGILVGQSVVSRYIDLLSTVEALGVFMAWMHYKMLYDGNDLEFVLGKKCDESRHKIFVLDFGMVKRVDLNDTSPLESSLNALPYFPLSFTCMENQDEIVKNSFRNIINIFKNSYLQKADNYGMLEVAKKIYENAV